MAEAHLPTLAEIDALLDAHEVPARTRVHANAVASLAYWLAIRLRERGIELDPLLVHRAGLLHDVGRGVRDPNRSHTELGAEVLREAGYDDLAEIIARHSFHCLLTPAGAPVTWEQKLVCYADKVSWQTPGGMRDRLIQLSARSPEQAEAVRAAALALEQQICAVAGLTPEEAVNLLPTHGLLEPAAAVLSVAHWTVLRELVTRLQGQPVLWALTGSVGLALRGVPVPAVHDLDVQADADGAYVIERAFPGPSVRPVTYVESERIRSHYGEMRIAGLKVELMGDVAHRAPSGAWGPPLDLATLITWVDAAGLHLPVMSLAHEQQAYLTLGRPEKASLIAATLAKRNVAPRGH